MTTSPTPAELHIDQVDDDAWTWRFVEGDLELNSNETYDTRDAAADAARRAYPDLALEGEEEP